VTCSRQRSAPRPAIGFESVKRRQVLREILDIVGILFDMPSLEQRVELGARQVEQPTRFIVVKAADR
jgi:hypothetical protein